MVVDMVGDPKTNLKALVASYEVTQKGRLSDLNRLKKMKLIDKVRQLLQQRIKEGKLWEGRIRRKMRPFLEYFNEWSHWLAFVDGFGEVLAGKILSQIDWNKVRYPSSLYMFFGLICDDKGRAYKPKRGEMTPYKPSRKGIIFNAARSLANKGTGYKKLFEKLMEDENRKARFTILVRDLDNYYTGHLFIQDSTQEILTKEKIARIKKTYDPSDELVLMRTRKHRYFRGLRRLGKCLLGHLTMFHFWFEEKKLVLPYQVVYCEGHNHVYMPVIDVDKETLESDDRFIWWHELYDAVKDAGKEPVSVLKL